MRDPRTGAVRVGDVVVLGPADLVCRRPVRRLAAGRRGRAARGGEQALKRIWVIIAGEADGPLYAGGDPGVLFESRDDGATLGAQPRALGPAVARNGSRAAAACSCTRSCTWPGEPDRLAVAISAAGVWLTDDGGDVAPRATAGSSRTYVPEEARGRAPTCASTTSSGRRARPSGCSCSSTGASTGPTTPASAGPDIGGGLPSNFGFPVALDPADPTRYVIPLVADWTA